MNKIIVGIHSIINSFILCLLIFGPVQAQTASILPPAQTTFFDANGNPLTSGTVESFVPGQSTHKTTWLDSAETIPNQNPLTLDAAGRAIIWGDGAYRQVVKDSNGNLIWDAVTASPGGGSGTGGTVGDSNSVGAVIPWAGFTVPPQYLYAAGQAVSRTGFPLLYSILTQTSTVTCTGGNPTLTSLTDTSQLNIGAVVEAACSPANATIISKTSTSVTLSANATLSISTSAIFYPYGNGDGLTTFNLPDYRGVMLPGRNNMNGVASANLSNPTYTDPNALNGGGGSQTKTLSVDQLPAGITSLQSSGFNVTVTSNATNVVQGGIFPSAAGSGTGISTISGATSSAVTSTGTVAAGNVTTTSNNTLGHAFGIIPPSKTVNYIIKVLPNPVVTAANCIQMQDAGTACKANTGTSGHAVPFLDGTNTFSGTNTFTNGITINGTAASLVGNKTSSTGADVDFTISGLANKSVPDANADMLLLWDNAANNFKKVSPGQIASTGVSGVSSLDGAVGVLTTETGSLKVVGTQLSSNVLSSRAFAITQNLSSFSGVQTLGYTVAGDGGKATFKNIGSAAFTDSKVTAGVVVAAGTCTNGTYLGVQFSGGTGTGLTATVVVSGGTVITSNVTITGTGGQGYSINDVLTENGTATPVLPCSTPFTYRVTAISTPTGSFSDAVGTHFQIEVPGAGIDARSFGYKNDWAFATGDGAATDNFNPLQNALNFASTWSTSIPDLGGTEGGLVLLPKFTGMFCGPGNVSLLIPGGVELRGQGKFNTAIKPCDAFNSFTNIYELCDPTIHSSCFDAKITDAQLYMSSNQDSSTSTTASIVHTNNDQDTVLLDNVKIYPGACRKAITLEGGFGGTTYNTLRNIELAGGKAAAGCGAANALIFINYGTTWVKLIDIAAGGLSPGSGGPRDNGIAITGGFVTIDGYHSEQIVNPIILNIPGGLGNGWLRAFNLMGGVDCVGMVELIGGNTNGNFMLSPPMAINGCSQMVTNGQSGGVNFVGPAVQDTIFNPNHTP